MALSYYKGKYTIEFTADADLSRIPKNVDIIDKNVTVWDGTVQQVMGGIQFYSGNNPFSLGYKFIKRILDKDKNELWKNYNY